jgi:SAM-dependent methyltransferase
MVRPGGHVLDLGCGAGLPSTRRLAGAFSVVGVDILAEQLARARKNVPGAELIRADWLRPGGVFLASLGSGDLAAWTGDWLGVPMFFSSHPATENRRLLDGAALEAVHDVDRHDARARGRRDVSLGHPPA